MGHQVDILGGSYGSIAAMRRLSKNPEIQVTLKDQHPYHFANRELETCFLQLFLLRTIY